MTVVEERRNIRGGFDHSYAELPTKYYEKCEPSPLTEPELIIFNDRLAGQIGLSYASFSQAEMTAIFAGNTKYQDADFISMAYAGHQFGNFVSQLGDGRAHVMGELVDAGGKRRSVQLKGSGKTPFSRGGDGRSPLGPVIREYLVSEAMAVLNIPTTRALAMVAAKDKVIRQQGLVPAGVMTRVAESFVRIGTFEYFKSKGDLDGVKELADYVIAHHYPELKGVENQYLRFFEEVCERQLELVATWMSVGFIHGVMNTDNSSIVGETIDYGPCAFMDKYNPKTVYSSIDMHGRYSFVNQGAIIGWNLNSLGFCLAHLLGDDEEQGRQRVMDVLKQTQPHFVEKWIANMRKKAGLKDSRDDDYDLVRHLLEIMEEQEADYTLVFRYLADNVGEESLSERFVRLFSDAKPVEEWAESWRKRVLLEKQDAEVVKSEMNRVNPAFIPRNHRVEKAIRLAEDQGDYSEVILLNKIYSNPFQEDKKYLDYMLPPESGEEILQTFCGT